MSTHTTALAAPPAVPASRAGRNLPAAIAVGLFLGALVLVPLYTYRPAFGAIVAVALAYAAYELTRVLSQAAARRVPLVPVAAGIAGTYWAAWNQGSADLAAGVLVTAVVVIGWRSAPAVLHPERGADGLVGDLAASVWVVAYLVLLGGFAILLAARPDGAARVTTFVATVVCADVGGYAAGVLIGRHKLAPRISPKKSWEGLGGSLVACLTAGSLFAALLLHIAVWEGLVFGVAMTVTAIVGDLAESLVKRDLEVKDMGHLLPGHGGIMDRLDSLLLSAPVAYLLITQFLRH